jgi:hypothetical protein
LARHPVKILFVCFIIGQYTRDQELASNDR